MVVVVHVDISILSMSSTNFIFYLKNFGSLNVGLSVVSLWSISGKDMCISVLVISWCSRHWNPAWLIDSRIRCRRICTFLDKDSDWSCYRLVKLTFNSSLTKSFLRRRCTLLFRDSCLVGKGVRVKIRITLLEPHVCVYNYGRGG